MTLIADKASTEFNHQVNMIIALMRMNFVVEGEVVPKGYPGTRFDVCVMRGREIIGVVEMKRNTSGNMQKHEKDFWQTEQGTRYWYIGYTHKIPVLYCAGPSEINRVAKAMKRALSPWFLRWFV